MNKTLIALACCSLTSPALACAPLSPALQGTLERSARTFHLDSALLSALIWTESHFCMRARSPVGAVGLGQLMPGTARALGVNPHDPHQNIYGAAKYLSQMWKKFNNRSLAIAAYNAGPGAVQRYRGIPPYRETQAYVRKVLSAYPQQLIAMGRRPRQELLAAAPRSSARSAAQRRFNATLLTVARPPKPQARTIRAALAAARVAASASVAVNTTLIARRNTADQLAQAPQSAVVFKAASPSTAPTPSDAWAPLPVARPALAQTKVPRTQLAQTQTTQNQPVQTPVAQAPAVRTQVAQTRAVQTRPAQTRAASALSPEKAPVPELASAPAQAEPFTAPTSLSLFDDASPASSAPADSLNVFGDFDTGEAAPQGSVGLGAGSGMGTF